MFITYLDIETTNLYERYVEDKAMGSSTLVKPDIIQLSMITACKGNFIKCYNKFYTPHYDEISTSSYEVHGLDEAFLYQEANGDFELDIPEICRYLSTSSLLVTHNVEFDVGRLRAYDNPLLNSRLDKLKTFCTMSQGKNYKRAYSDKKPKLLVMRNEEAYNHTIPKDNWEETIEQDKKEFKEIFGIESTLTHDARWDVFMTFKHHTRSGIPC